VAEPRLQPTVKFKPVHAPSLPELRELNELNFGRFDAKLEQRIAELRAEVQAEFAELRAEMRGMFGALEPRFAAVEVSRGQMETRLTKRLFAFWIAQAATTVGLILGVVKLLH
jgi:hypothetical protein